MRSLVLALLSSVLAAEDIGPTAIRDVYAPAAGNVVESVARMADDQRACALFRARGLDVLSVTWEDTGRSKNSCWGPNISDLTIQVLGQQQRLAPGCFPNQAGWCMPVVRHPNFADVSCDVPIERLKVLVGNEHGSGLQAIDLGSYLRSFASYQTSPTGRLKGSLIGERDHAVLVSAQACYLPIPRGGEATFAPVLFNYQSAPGAPAVLTLVVTPEGTSAQAITNSSAASAGVWHGQRLYHNRAGQRAPLSAKRLSDVGATTTTGQAVTAGSATAAGMSMVMVIQIPLVHPESRFMGGECDLECAAAPAAAGCAMDAKESSRSESAVVQSGPVEGPWIGLDGCTIERDWRFPIRATVQFYQATDTAEVVPADVDRLAKAIDRIYLSADAVGSLVTDSATCRPTEHSAAPAWPQPFYKGVCEDYSTRTGESWQTALARVHARLGVDWQPVDARELTNALALARP